MDSVKKNKRRRWLFWVLCVFVVLCVPVFLLWYVYVSAPGVLEFGARMGLRFFGVSEFVMDVERLSLDEVCIRDIRAGLEDYPGVVVQELHIMRSGSSSGVNKIIVTGLGINIVESGGKVFIPGIVFSRGNPDAVGKPADLLPLVERVRIPAVLLKFIAPGVRVDIRDSVLALRRLTEHGESRLELPFELDLSVSGEGVFRLDAAGFGRGLSRVPFAPQGLECEELRVSISSEGKLSADSRCEGLYAKFAVEARGLKGSLGGKMGLDIPQVGLSGGVSQDSDRLDGEVSAKFAGGGLDVAGASLKEISGDISLGFLISEVFRWEGEVPGEGGSGWMDVGEILYKGSGLGCGAVVFRQSGGDLLIDGGVLSDKLGGKESSISLAARTVLPGGRVSGVGKGGTEAEIKVANARFDVGIFSPKMKGMVVSGDAVGSFVSDGRSSLAGAKIAGANIDDLDKGISARGVNLDFDMPDLRVIRSGPAQRLSFASFKYKDFDFGSGEIRFQMETSRRIFLERSAVEWCGGNMDFGAVRVDLDNLEELDFTFFCDRMRVADFLGQLKIAQASGEGRVAGRIPVAYSNGKLHIKNGYLYSTPGEGGRIQLKDFAGSELAATSIQMAIAREALRDYSYNWVRMGFNTFEDMMHIRLELDGAPSGRLPFAFDERTVLRPSVDGEQKAMFQGISFDINFNIPLDEILRYGRRAGSMFK